MVSVVYRYMTRQAWGRVAVVTGFAQGQQRIRIEPGHATHTGDQPAGSAA